MQLYTNYQEAFQAALASRRFAVAHLQSIQLPMNIDTSACYKLFYFISGQKKFHIDHLVYDVAPGDLFFVNQREAHYFSHFKDTQHHERIVIFIYPDYLRSLSTGMTDLCACFSQQADRQLHKFRLQAKESNRLMHLISKLKSDSGFGEDLMTTSIFLELTISVNRIRLLQTSQSDETYSAVTSADMKLTGQASAVLAYIDSHLTEELTLEILSGAFYLTPSYLCRVFKKETGITIHKYITARRITLAKDLLAKGYSVTDACSMSGFKDYNGFLKSFVNSVGISPKKYAQFSSL